MRGDGEILRESQGEGCGSSGRSSKYCVRKIDKLSVMTPVP
ncbi:hypothetical protein [Crocosphaera chwakensis]|nr:hypothetical protein [Crocosphaera chwakensis]